MAFRAMQSRLQRWFEQQWQYTGPAQLWLRPLSWLFAGIVASRRLAYSRGWLRSTRLAVPVIVVGNVSVGGVGKTPLVVYLAEHLRAAGYQPGILSRGYGSQYAGEVRPYSDAHQCGDEPVLLARRSGCPVWVHPSRVRGGQALLKAYPQVNVVLCDDGLQHYALQRQMEIAVVQRPLGLGNGQLLPAGPLREPYARLQHVDIVVESGVLPEHQDVQQSTYQQRLHAGGWTALNGAGQQTTVAALQSRRLMAIAGIGHPQRFFEALHAMGLVFDTRVFADHHAYCDADFDDLTGYTLLMTEKDAVKCAKLGLQDAWYLPVSADVQPRSATQPSLEATVIRLLTRYQGAHA